MPERSTPYRDPFAEDQLTDQLARWDDGGLNVYFSLNETQGWARAAAAAWGELSSQATLTSLPPWTPGEHQDGHDEEEEEDDDEEKDVNCDRPALPLLWLCGGPRPPWAPVQLPQVQTSYH